MTTVYWKLAVVESLVAGNDGLVRSANIRTKNGITNRPVLKLYPLEVTSDATNMRSQVVNEPDNQEGLIINPSGLHIDNRPKRRAAEQARKQIRDWARCIRAPPEDVGDCD